MLHFYPNLIGKENRLIYRLMEDVNDPTRYTRRVAEANADAQARTYQEAVSRNQQTAATQQASAGNLAGAAYYSNSAESLKPAPVTMMDQNGPTSASILDQARQSARGAVTYNNQTGQTTPKLQFGDQIAGALPGFTAPTLSGNSTAIESDVRKRYADMGISDPAIINDGIAKAIQADNARNQAADIASQKASSSASSSAASNAAANEMQQSTSKIPGSMEIALAGLPAEDAAAIRAALEASLGAGDQAKNAALGNYATDVNAADSSMNAYSKVLDGMKEDSTLINNATQGFIDDMQARREKSAAEAKTNALNQLKSEEMRLDRKMKADNDKRINSLVLGQAIGGGFGSSNWIAEVSQAEWDGEQAINDMHEDFGFKSVDVELRYKDTLDGIYELAGSSKLDALKTYKSELQNIGNLRFSATEKTEDRKATARKTLNDTFAAIAKTQAADIKAAAEDVRTYAKEVREEKRTTQKQLWDRFFQQRAMDGNTNPGLTSQILRDMQSSGIDVSGIDPNTMTLDQINELQRQQVTLTQSSGKTPLATQVKQLAEADNAFSLLDRAERAIQDYAGVGGPISGMTGIGDIENNGGFVGDIVDLVRAPSVALGTLVPGVGNSLERQREAVATFNLVKQVIGKAMEGGVLRKEDEAKYERLLPTLRDTDRLRSYKLQQLREAMQDGKRALLNNMQSSGYNTSGYMTMPGGVSIDPIMDSNQGPLTNQDADEILQHLESGEPLTMGTPTGFLAALANSHMKHEGYGTPGAPTITKGNNPGALRWHPGQAAFGGKPGPKNFTVFPDFDSGYKALVADLRAKLTGKSAHIDYNSNPTLLSYVKVYAPTADGNNPTGYAAALVKSLRKAGYNVSLDTPLSELSSLIG